MKPQEELRAGRVSVGMPVYNGARYLRETLAVMEESRKDNAD